MINNMKNFILFNRGTVQAPNDGESLTMSDIASKTKTVFSSERFDMLKSILRIAACFYRDLFTFKRILLVLKCGG